MPRFAILVHDHPFLHWDFLLEEDDHCRTWRLLQSLDSAPGEIGGATALDAHRKMYLDYEGPVSGQRGTVTRWDAGTFEWLVQEADDCQVILNGARWQGLVRLVRVAGDDWTVTRKAGSR